MERLLELARKSAEAVTVYQESWSGTGVSFEDGALKDIESAMRSGTRLLLVKDGRLGFAYTTNLADRGALVERALASARRGPEVGYALPASAALPSPASYDPAAEDLGSEALVAECGRILERLAALVPGGTEMRAGAEASVGEARLMNSLGASYSARSSSFETGCACLYPASASAMSADQSALAFEGFPADRIEELASLYVASLPERKPAAGRMKVLLMPDAVYALAWRLVAATSAKSVRLGISPIADKMGERLLSERVDLYIDCLDDRFPGARAFDDEGTPCRRLDLFRRGALAGFYADRDYAARIGVEATGCGWAGGLSAAPAPSARGLAMSPGSSSFRDMIASIDRGIVVQSVLGAHSGNIPNGDFSIGLAPGLYVEGGEVVGRVGDAMMAGNVYDVMRRVAEVGDRARPARMGTFPAISLEDVPVALKS